MMSEVCVNTQSYCDDSVMVKFNFDSLITLICLIQALLKQTNQLPKICYSHKSLLLFQFDDQGLHNIVLYIKLRVNGR